MHYEQLSSIWMFIPMVVAIEIEHAICFDCFQNLYAIKRYQIWILSISSKAISAKLLAK